MKKREDFKYHATFEAVATFNHKKWLEAKASGGSVADLSDLRSLLPSDEEIADNPDLLYVSFNAAVANLVNANGHGIGTDTALAVSKYFVSRQMNLEHDRNEIVGHIISQGFSTFGEKSNIVTAETLSGSNDPFNICLGAVVYKVSRGYIAEILAESSKPGSELYHEIATSWEIGFDDFDIVLGSKKIADATIITDEAEKEKYLPYLRMNGGNEVDDTGTPVYCLIKGDARPLGCAFTGNPAAAVTGILAIASVEEENEEESNATNEALAAELAESKEKLEALALELQAAKEELSKKTENIEITDSQSPKTTVTTNSMKIKRIEDITPELFQNEATASIMKDFITEQLADNASEAVAKLKEEEEARKEAEATLKEAQETLLSLQSAVDELKAEKDQREKQEVFSSRMEEINSEFELSPEQSKAVASQIKELDADSFSAWKSNIFAPFATKKTATASVETNESEEQERLEALRQAEASTNVNIPNAQSPEKTVDVKNLFKDLISFTR